MVRRYGIRNFASFSLLLILILLVLPSCSETKMQRVLVKARPLLNIEKYDNVYLAPFRISSEINNQMIAEEIKKTLKEDLAINYGKNVITGEKINIYTKGIFSNPFFWREYAKKEKSAVITGIIKIKKEERSKITTVRSTPLSLKSQNILKTIKLINCDILFLIFDGESGKKFYQYRFNYKITDESGETDSVLVSKLISIGVDRLMNRILQRERIVYRYFFNY